MALSQPRTGRRRGVCDTRHQACALLLSHAQERWGDPGAERSSSGPRRLAGAKVGKAEKVGARAHVVQEEAGHRCARHRTYRQDEQRVSDLAVGEVQMVFHCR